MNYKKSLPLTETTFYILLSLMEPMHGYGVMQKVEELSDGNVRIAAGTMYGAIENLSKNKFIKTVPSKDKRRKLYQVTEDGKKLLELEAIRLKHCVNVINEILGGD